MQEAVQISGSTKSTANLPGKLVDVEREVFGGAPKSSHFKEALPTGISIIAEKFKTSLDAAKSAGAGYRTALNESLAKAYAAFHIYHNAQTDEQKEALRQQLELFCVEAKVKITTNGGTKPEHMIIRLAFGDQLLSTTVSQRARLLRLAASKDENVAPGDFGSWLGKKGGIVAALGGNISSSSGIPGQRVSPAQYKKSVESGRDALKAQVLLNVDSAPIGDAIRPQTTTNTLAIVEVREDGTFAIRAFVQDADTLDAAYAAYYRENADEIERVAMHSKITGLLTSGQNLSMEVVRTELGDEVADRVKEAWESDSQYNKEMRQAPAELEDYLRKLHAADRLSRYEDKTCVESAYEKALEDLLETMEMYPQRGLDQHLDRPYNDKASPVSPERASMPRWKGSKSPENKGTIDQIDKQKSLRMALEDELSRLTVAV